MLYKAKNGKLEVIAGTTVASGDTSPVGTTTLFDGDTIPSGWQEVEEVYSNPNLLINGDFQIWQRGEEFILSHNSATYTADRHKTSLSNFGDKVKITKSENGLKLETTTVTANANRDLQYNLESKDIEKLKGKVVTFSIKARKLTKTSEVSLTVFGKFGNETYKKIFLNNTEFETFTFTFTFNPNLTETNTIYSLDNNSVEVGGGFEVAWLKLEQGSIATPFVPRLYAEELILCKRYFTKTNVVAGFEYKYTNHLNKIVLCTSFDEMRSIPTLYSFKAQGTSGGNPTYSYGTDIVKMTHTNLRGISTFNANIDSTCYAANVEIVLDAEIY